MWDDMRLFSINKRVERLEFLAVLSRMKKDRRKVPVNICVGTHTEGGKKTSLSLTQLKLVTDQGQGQPAASHLRQKDRLEGKLKLGELDNIRLEFGNSTRQADPGRDETKGPLPTPRRPADLVPSALPGIRMDVLTCLRVKKAPQIQNVFHLKVVRQSRQLIFLSGDECHIQPFGGKRGAELIGVVDQSTASIGFHKNEAKSMICHTLVVGPDRVPLVDGPVVQC